MSGREVDAGAPLVAWRDPVLDCHVAVGAWIRTEMVADQFIVRERSLRMVWNYLWRVGPVAVLRKVRSRLAESDRNVRIAGTGRGVIVAAPSASGLRVGDPVVFVAPNHSSRWAVLSLDTRLVRAAERSEDSARATVEKERGDLRALAGWSRWSGRPLDLERVAGLLVAAAAAERPEAPSSGVKSASMAVRERREAVRAPSGRPTAVVIGLGNYAKTQVVPPVRRHLDLRAVHEIDPDQVLAAAATGAALDTSPRPREGARYDAWFIAGFHHTHADLATDALRSGAYAVCEKPLATTPEQLDRLRTALAANSASRLLACFHKRYSELTAWALEDLARGGRRPIDMHALVYEIPLPPRHWYNWPNSGSRLISNGCHWIDLFLYVNEYAPCRTRRVTAMRGSDVSVVLRLENGAQFSMVLTEAGSERLGVRDHVELRAADVTVKLTDATDYEAEDSRRVLRRGRRNPMRAYSRMYEAICRRILSGTPGDPLDSLASTQLVLDLEQDLRGLTSRPGTGVA